MADSSPALSLREGGPRAPRPSAPSPPPRSRSGSESEEAELSLSLARTKTRSYGSTASVRAPLGAGVIERHVEHRVRAGDTLQGIALKYGVTEEEPVVAGEDLPPPSPQESDVQPVQPEEVSARDFLQRLDLQIKLSTQAAKKLKEESRDEESPYATSLYHS